MISGRNQGEGKGRAFGVMELSSANERLRCCGSLKSAKVAWISIAFILPELKVVEVRSIFFLRKTGERKANKPKFYCNLFTALSPVHRTRFKQCLLPEIKTLNLTHVNVGFSFRCVEDTWIFKNYSCYIWCWLKNKFIFFSLVKIYSKEGVSKRKLMIEVKKLNSGLER